ncbi:MAG TPA: carboxypeptidase regulatory-like domain-containing protein [Candidatus Hydrogenedentes bacterium]|nr:carboxypeptidase regulatory-like domain-containing protein [Candidatus Hydrogenedentota bacterium]
MSRLRANSLRVSFVVACIALFAAPLSFAASKQAPPYRFERMWPMLSQPWFFNDPIDVAVRGNVVYVSDSLNGRVKKFTLDGQLITNLAVGYPFGLTTDAAGNLYVADQEGILKYDTAGALVLSIVTVDVPGEGESEEVWPSDVAVAENGDIYLVARFRILVQQYDASGQFIRQWDEGPSSQEGAERNGIDVGANGRVYVSDVLGNRVKVYTPEGQWLFDIPAPAPPEGASGFYGPAGMTVDASGFVYVAELYNGRVLRFTPEGVLDASWGIESLASPGGVGVDSTGNVYVAEIAADRVQKFSPDGRFVTQWSTAGSVPGMFRRPEALDISFAGKVYVADTENLRVQVFSETGEYEREWRLTGDFEPDRGMAPVGIVVDEGGFVYVSNQGNEGEPILKFTLDGALAGQWGNEENFSNPCGIAIDSEGNVYIADSGSDPEAARVDRVLKYSPTGELLKVWGQFGHGGPSAEHPDDPIQFAGPRDIAIDAEDNVYVTDAENARVQKFTSEGDFLLQWGELGEGSGQLAGPHGIDVDSSGNLFVVDTDNVGIARVEVFTPEGDFLYSLGRAGETGGEFSEPRGIALSADGRIFVADTSNDRVQAFRPVIADTKNRAVLVAGGGADAGGGLWAPTQMLANFAYHTLRHQGFAPEDIHYLSSDRTVDLDNDANTEEVAGDATAVNLEQAITSWAMEDQAERAIVYLVGPGGEAGFQINPAETVSAVQLDGWLDTLQSSLPGSVVVVYDASNAGSILTNLTGVSGKKRIVLTSASGNEEAYFVTNGTLSFSNYFWLGLFNGQDVQDAFDAARDAMGGSVAYQHPQLDANGNGVANEPEDYALAAGVAITSGIPTFDEFPTMAAVSPPQELAEDQTTALFSASGVVDDRLAIARVWGVITPPGGIKKENKTILELPGFDLNPGGDGSFTGSFHQFDEPGTYQVDIYAIDGNLNIAAVKSTAVTKAGILAATLVCSVWDADSGEHTPIVNATVTISPLGMSVTENINGVYTFVSVPAGTYGVSVTAPEYQEDSRTVVLPSGETTTLNIPLHRSATQEGEGQNEGEGEGETPQCACAAGTYHPGGPAQGLGGDFLITMLALLTLLIAAKKRDEEKHSAA